MYIAYLKESRPLALSRKRDAWLLFGAATAALVLLVIIIVLLTFITKRKRAQSALNNAPAKTTTTSRRILAKDAEYAGANIDGITNHTYTSETDVRVSKKELKKSMS